MCLELPQQEHHVTFRADVSFAAIDHCVLMIKNYKKKDYLLEIYLCT